MDTRHLKSFLRIAETRSISRAADSLGIAQPSLSQQLLRLEDEVGLKLFRRTARGVTLTEAGRIFQEHARHLLDASEAMLEDVRQHNSAASGQVVLAVPPTIARLIAVPLVEMLLAEAPRVTVRLVEAFAGSIRGWLEDGKIDLGILYDLPLRQLSMRRLVSEELMLAGPHGTFDPGADVTFERLADYPLIAPGPQHGLRQLIDRESTRHGVMLTVAQEIDAFAPMLALVAAGAGYTIMPRSIASADLSMATIEGGALRRTLCLVRNPNHVVSYASVRVEDILARVMKRMIASGGWDARPEAFLH
jgi:LysR family nitrogen assimilation transcriptional regulator